MDKSSKDNIIRVGMEELLSSLVETSIRASTDEGLDRMIEQARTNLGLMYTERGRRERIAKGRKQSAPPVDAILEVFGTEPGVSASEQIMETLRQAGFEVEEIPEAELCDEDRRAIEAKKRDLAAKGHDPESVHSGAFRYRMAQDCTAPGCKLHNPNGREAPRG